MDSISLIREKLKKQAISPRLVLGKCQLMDDMAKNLPAFTEHLNLPFYYYLGKYLPRDKIINFGFGLGLPLIFYMLGHRAKKILAQHDPGNQFYSSRVGVGNFIRVLNKRISCFVGPASDESFLSRINSEKWQGVIINTSGLSFDSIMYTMNVSWNVLEDNGYICLDYSGNGNSRNASENFSKLVNRKAKFIGSRYGHSIIFKDI